MEPVNFQVLTVRAVDADVSPENSIVTYSILVSSDNGNAMNVKGLYSHCIWGKKLNKNNQFWVNALHGLVVLYLLLIKSLIKPTIPVIKYGLCVVGLLSSHQRQPI